MLRLQAIQDWWRGQKSEFTKRVDGVWHTDGNALEVAHLELRQRVGRELQRAFPGWSACGRCEMSWGFVDHHDTSYSENGGIFVLCGRCWRELHHSRFRMPYYRTLFNQWVSQGCTDIKWADIERAVIAEDIHSELIPHPFVS